MKKYSLMVCLLGALAACEEEEEVARETTMRINHYTQNCQGVAAQQCFLVQEGDQVGSPDWRLFYDTIEGFDYEEGFVYTLQVRIEKVENPPADASGRRYRLLKVISKEKV
ncbi:DUF4377 domain-containing protein [Rufibacter quisquiliarum]|uniref:DUF4377 domain-containing protein n=1 Tax=Rufibacter quisquiliarum TaxID=1549639 RepID=A0A839GBP3_9BACT|nr:DUF4377 domain-containing protein [Rufibacter quisquiliarum]MBA9075730.1 hypothetical protein [Rufibacter quisquiliarum]